jgi:hypothetical protein
MQLLKISNSIAAAEVKILSSTSSPPNLSTLVDVFYRQAGIWRAESFDARRPTTFEKIVVSSMRKTLPPSPARMRKIASLRDSAAAARSALAAVTRRMRPTRNLNASVFDLRDTEPNNVSHLLTSIIPYCLYCRKVAGPDVVFLFPKTGAPFRELLAAFDIHPVFFTGRVRARIVKVQAMRGLAVYELMNAFDCEGINFFQDIYKPFDFRGSVRVERLFIARRGPRAIRNQAEVESLVSRYGYQTVYMEDHSIRDQLSIGAQARHVISPHGAAMAFLLMSESIDSVIELMPPHVYNSVYPVSLHPRVRRYEQIIADYDLAIPQIGYDAVLQFKNAPFEVDLRQLEARLTSVLVH